MKPRHGDFDYEQHGQSYAGQRRTDPRIAARIHAALGAARTVLNVGAGAGSYEPGDRHVIAIEPSAVMRAQRPVHLAPAIHGTAEALPLDDGSVDAAMAMVTIHQWSDPLKGLRELRRVARGPVVILSFDPDAVTNFWITRYAPELVAVDQRRFPAIRFVTDTLGGSCAVETIRVPRDCVDGFQEAFYARPEAFLQAVVRKGQSAWGFLASGVEDRAVQTLARDLESGAWDQRFGHLRTQAEFAGALRLITCTP